MRINNTEIEKYRAVRFSSINDGNNGLFIIDFKSTTLKIIASDQLGWDHVSVSTKNRCPNWFEMKFVKELFFDDEETVVQFHPKESQYVNNHEFCLHMWREHGVDYTLPPASFVGIK